MATLPSHGLRSLTTARPWLLNRRPSSTFASLSSSSMAEDSAEAPQPSASKPSKSNKSYFPKRGQTLELLCESLAFKGKGLCKVADTGFVVMCDRALPGERFIGRVTRKKENYAEVFFRLLLVSEKMKQSVRGTITRRVSFSFFGFEFGRLRWEWACPGSSVFMSVYKREDFKPNARPRWLLWLNKSLTSIGRKI